MFDSTQPASCFGASSDVHQYHSLILAPFSILHVMLLPMLESCCAALGVISTPLTDNLLGGGSARSASAWRILCSTACSPTTACRDCCLLGDLHGQFNA